MAKMHTEAMERLNKKKKNKSQDKAVGVWAEVAYRLSRNRAAVFGLVIILILVLFALFPQAFAGYGYDDQDYSRIFIAPCAEHPMGTDDLGRDIFSRVVYGTRISLSVGLISMLCSLLLGGLLGSLSAVNGGVSDNVIMRICDVFMSIPGTLLAISICAALGTGMTNLIIAITIALVPSFSRTVRAAILTVKDQEYIEAARAIGASKARPILRHMFPNALGPIIVRATLDVTGGITTAAALSFIGLGVAPPTPEWGCMLTQAKQYITSLDKWYIVVFPGVMIMITVFALNLFGDGLRDAFDPRSKN